MRPRRAPTTPRVYELAGHFYSLGAYTQADEVVMLCIERDELRRVLKEMRELMHSYSPTPSFDF